MADYRICELDERGHSSRLPWLMTCKDDHEAELEARKALNAQALEIWCGHRKVATIKPTIR